MTESTKIWYKALITVAIGIIVAVLLFKNDFDINALQSINFDMRALVGISLAVLCMLGREIGMAWRFRTLSYNRLSFYSAIKLTMLCEFMSCITPTSVGGSASSAIFMTRYGISGGRSTAIMIATLFLDELFITLIVPACFLLIPYLELFGFEQTDIAHDLQVGFWSVYGIIVAWCTLLGIGLFKSPTTIKKLLTAIFSLPILKRWYNKVNAVGDDLVTSANELKSYPTHVWIKAFAATTLSWISRFVTVNALIWGLIAGTDQLLALGRQVVVWVLLMFTPTPGGSGLSEWIFTKYYGDIVYSASTILIIAILWRIITYYAYLVIGIPLLPTLYKKQHLSDTTKRVP